jgi:hypothetical protein
VGSLCCAAGHVVPAATVYAPDFEQVAETVPPVEQIPMQVKPGAWFAHPASHVARSTAGGSAGHVTASAAPAGNTEYSHFCTHSPGQPSSQEKNCDPEQGT